MPTFNQLVRQGRSEKQFKSKAPVLQKGFNTIKNTPTDFSAPQKRLKQQLIFPELDTTFRNTQLYSSEAEGLETSPVCVITSSEVAWMLRVLRTANRADQSTVQRDLSKSKHQIIKGNI